MLLVLLGVPRLPHHFIPDRQLALTMSPVVMFALLVPTALYFLPRYRRSKQLTDEGSNCCRRGGWPLRSSGVRGLRGEPVALRQKPVRSISSCQ
ncbi:hypothetical protein D7W82_11860 [Corallococcus sp. CA049B]|nr:hypothetical protein D7W82_11860 [Corallococcus sp. CA049B]